MKGRIKIFKELNNSKINTHQHEKIFKIYFNI